jgi:hypothetical protein
MRAANKKGKKTHNTQIKSMEFINKRTMELRSGGHSKAKKRSCEDDSEVSRKKLKPDGSSGNAGASGSGGPTASVESRTSSSSSGKPTPEVQCGFYGVELLRSSWDRTHAIVMLLDSKSCLLHSAA